MKSLLLSSFACVLILSMPNAQAAQRIKNCGTAATQEMRQAVSFVRSNISTIMANTTRLTKKEKRKLRKKVRKVNLKCMDHKNVCKNSGNTIGVSRHLFNSAVVICYNKIRDFYGNNAFCALVDTIAHEFAHTAGVYKARGHNNGHNNDRVYRLGDAAESLCADMGYDSRIPRNTND